MKLLMITRKVDKNEHLAGFIYNWVKKLAVDVEKLIVISWQQGDSSGLPDNVEVIHLKTKQNKLFKIAAFKKQIWKNIKKVDGVFCHQMPIYTIIAAPFAKLYKKKLVSWYTHSQVDFKMKLMEKLTDVVVTASPESFRLNSKKVKVLGHGIDTEIFYPSTKDDYSSFDIVTVGRISPTKDYESMIKAVGGLRVQGTNKVTLKIIGDIGLADHASYLDSLKQMVKKMKLSEKVFFVGSKPNYEIPKVLSTADLFINLSGTGSLDKAVLEAMSTQTLVLTSNEAFAKILPAELMVEKDNPGQLAEKITTVMNMSSELRAELEKRLRSIVVANHNLENLTKKLVGIFNL